MYINSFLTDNNPFNTTEDIRLWIKQRNRDIEVKVDRIPFAEMEKWHSDYDGSLHHDSGKFFSIVGIDVSTDFGSNNHWRQPIILQPEIGILGILAKEVEGVLYFLMQAKVEPGNVNCVQISPTLQATKSNYTREHQGKSPYYLDYFLNAKPESVILDQLQSEQGARFLRKRNRNIIVKITEDIPVYEDFRWMTISQIKELLRYDNLVNMDTRTVISGLNYGEFEFYDRDDTGLTSLGRDLIASSRSLCSYKTIREILSWLTGLKSKYELFVDFCPLNEISHWTRTESEIIHDDNKFFKVIGVNVTISNREVSTWCQPLVQPMQQGLCAFIIKKINGIYHFLVQAKLECGNLDVFELAPTVQCLTGDIYSSGTVRPPFTDYVLNASSPQIIYDTILSEEGGRFYHEQNRNMIVEAGDDFDLYLPERYQWMTLGQIYEFLRFNNFLNIQARSLLSALNYN